ncbi:sugar ABC transporter substrate-binding protein [Blastococcus saxobsidens]|uniref:ABC-type sugar transport system n=1 Tax=Blastococcus saxobsidens (strain DD2) TaxID=1146883 RepID=H6RPE7_BLASD|nr:substrate-binding domain-containing protein [Blastococcus saxobsidens]CCG04006.1 ABC-type sugar transport system [Blastococcus saxobsidens DD2]
MRICRSTIGSTGAAVLAVALLAACSPGTTAFDSESASGASGAADGALADVQADVEAAMEPRDSFEVPTEPVDPSALAGQTVYYIPLTAQNRVFQLYGEKIGEALATVGVDLQVCDGGANPSQVGGCLEQAIGAGAAAIVTDSIPYGMAANGIEAARAAGIPVIIGNQLPSDEQPADETLAYVNAPTSEMVATVADWMTVDSGGDATVVLQKVTDNPSTIAFAEAGEEAFAENCPDCTVVVNEVSASNFPLIPSSTSAAILSNPDTGYVLSEFEVFVQPTIAGIQQTPNADQIQIGTAAASLDGLQQLADDQQLQADVAQNFRYQGWATADAIFRLVAGQEVPEYDVSYRLFTPANIGDIELTEEAQASGEWFGPTDYEQEFAALWGQN